MAHFLDLRLNADGKSDDQEYSPKNGGEIHGDFHPMVQSVKNLPQNQIQEVSIKTGPYQRTPKF